MGSITVRAAAPALGVEPPERRIGRRQQVLLPTMSVAPTTAHVSHGGIMLTTMAPDRDEDGIACEAK